MPMRVSCARYPWVVVAVLSIALMACPQTPITLQPVDGHPERCVLRVPNRTLAEVAESVSDQIGAHVVLGEEVNGRQRIDYEGEAPTCRAALDQFAADLGLVVRESEHPQGTLLELVRR